MYPFTPHNTDHETHSNHTPNSEIPSQQKEEIDLHAELSKMQVDIRSLRDEHSKTQVDLRSLRDELQQEHKANAALSAHFDRETLANEALREEVAHEKDLNARMGTRLAALDGVVNRIEPAITALLELKELLLNWLGDHLLNF